MDVVCRICNSNYEVMHLECIEYIDRCSCVIEDGDEFFCAGCQVEFEFNGHDKYDEFDELDYYSSNKELIYNTFKSQTQLFDNSPYSGSSKAIVPACTHEKEKIELFDGTIIYCSSYKSPLEEEKVADYGLYADYVWRPIHRNEHISWPDYKIPDNLEIALDQIEEAYFRSKEYKEIVQIGCIGGHGRTGTILACMQVLAGNGAVSGQDAVKFVKETYCKKAVETDLQQWFVEFAYAYWYNQNPPPKPQVTIGKKIETTKPDKNRICLPEEHYAMIIKGHKKCLVKDVCALFDLDLRKYHREGFASVNKSMVLEAASLYPEVGGKCDQGDHFDMMSEGKTECQYKGLDCETWEDDERSWSM